MKENILAWFQKFARSLMLPIALLAAVGILFGFTAAISREQVQDLLPILNNSFINYCAFFIRDLSIKIFGLIPVLFAISISIGLAKKEKGIAALAGFVCYYTIMVSASFVLSQEIIHLPQSALGSALGIDGVPEVGAIGGMLAGITTSFLHNKYYNIELPVAIAFFGGKRFVAIVVIVAGAIIGQVLPFIWLPISKGIESLGYLIATMGVFGSFLYGFLERILIPTGLHHLINGIFRTTAVGGELNGSVGVWNIFFENFGSVPIDDLKEYTRFLAQGKIPYMVFGLPAAALAIYHTTPKENKKKVEALLIAGTLACFTTGITEPLEFVFLFIAPFLFLFHAFMAGLSFMLMDILNVGIGNTQGGVIDLLVYGVLVPGSNWFYTCVVGAFYGFTYYFVFKWYFTKKGLVIDHGGEEEPETTKAPKGNIKIAKDVIEGLGGTENIIEVDNCFTRLRVKVKNTDDVNQRLLKSTKAIGIKIISKEQIQIIYGPKVNILAGKVKELLNGE